jgi:hypothetical protein
VVATSQFEAERSQQKINALDQAAPLAGWQLPEEFATLRRLLEARMGKQGRREFVQVLRLMEAFKIEEVTATVRDARARGAIGFDAVKHLVLCRIECRPPRLDMTIYPYLPRATVATTSAKACPDSCRAGSGRQSRTPSMHADEKSDEAIVLTKRPNKGRQLLAEVVEGRASPKGNSRQAAVVSDTEPSCHVDPIGGCAPERTRLQTVRRPTFDPREEPGALAAHAGICAGGEEQSSSLPRPSEGV